MRYWWQPFCLSRPDNIVRHPFYIGTPLVLAGQGLWLESTLSTMCAIVPTVFVIIRLMLGERFLQRELPGYSDYMARVAYRLLPGMWLSRARKGGQTKKVSKSKRLCEIFCDRSAPLRLPQPHPESYPTTDKLRSTIPLVMA
jgi:hypothetical protein